MKLSVVIINRWSVTPCIYCFIVSDRNVAPQSVLRKFGKKDNFLVSVQHKRERGILQYGHRRSMIHLGICWLTPEVYVWPPTHEHAFKEEDHEVKLHVEWIRSLKVRADIDVPMCVDVDELSDITYS